ncbi:hypothetical protein DASC09_004270 [Saccharomycopsis crataegensis]|uniref:Cell wall synthesis protein KRE9 n=1 Tax=Saccharomycopsis crataegensis TaxID=43959 RepID=A0AAV5QEC9_9ASCO|nr:hypothetical protein DASC09_004270 [Saccharomycopsis crataegensis]
MILSKISSLFSILFVFLLLINTSKADVSISTPASSKTFTVSGSTVSVDITWIDDGTSPSVSDVVSYTFVLCTGPSSEITAVQTIAESQTITSNSYTASIPASAGADGVYYIQIYAVYSNGHTIHYTRRFTLSGMTGTTEPSGAITDSVPSAQADITTSTSTAVTATMDVSASFSVIYTLQTGIYRFAPMQMQPGSTVTASTWSRKFPTSAVTYYTSPSSAAYQESTLTPGWSYTKVSIINHASALGSATGGYAASKKVKTPYISATATTSKQKRFLDLD